MAVLELKVPDDQQRQLMAQPFLLNRFLDALLNHQEAGTSEPNVRKLARMLVQYHYAEGISPEISEIEVTDCKFDTDTNRGEFVVVYLVNSYFSCSADEKQHFSNHRINFEINVDYSTVQMIFTDVPTRDTFEEF